MKNTAYLLLVLPALLLTGCQHTEYFETPIDPVEEFEAQDVPEAEEKLSLEDRAIEDVDENTKRYGGSWFDIEYPVNFTPSPTEPVNIRSHPSVEDTWETILTDEATFTSPEGAVEFFVYSPLWSGDPENYLEIAENEVLVSEKTETSGEGDTMITYHWVTVREVDGLYHRSYVSIKNENYGSSLHHVFGIKYDDADAYEMYRDEYVKFKNSLIQYAD